MPQTLAVEYSAWSKPGTARSRWNCPASQPALHGGQRFFFIAIAFVAGDAAVGTVSSTQRPQPGLSLSEPQHGSASPRAAARSSDAAPKSQSDSPCADGPPCSVGSIGAYAADAKYADSFHGCSVVESQPKPLQSQ